MSLAVVYSRVNQGLKATLVSVEVYISPGIPKFHIVGLPEKEVRESQYRVKAVIMQSQFNFPSRVITVNLAPADLPKSGGRFDLPIALGILAATGQIPKASLKTYEFLSEVSLSGELRAVKGALTAAIAATTSKRALVVPKKNSLEVSLASSAKAYAANNFLEVCEHLTSDNGVLEQIKPIKKQALCPKYLDLKDVYGQHHAARALEIVAAGGHHCLLVGAPGTGKTMLANRLPGILPPLSEEHALEVMAIRSLCGEKVTARKLYQRPFCGPHHSASPVALVGGGRDLRPGEITRAHRGILFMDELPEFQRQALETLREPLETRNIRLSRASGYMEYPANFQLVAAMNPCPDGSDVDERGRCACSEARLRQYYARLSLPFLDRIDMHIRVPRVRLGNSNNRSCEESQPVRARVISAYQKQISRQSMQNAQMRDSEVKVHCCLSKQDMAKFYERIDQLSISARAANRILRVARTIADLAQKDDLHETHVLEAMSYRSLDQLFKAN